MAQRPFARLRGRRWPLWSQVLLLALGVSGAAAVTIPGRPITPPSPVQPSVTTTPSPSTVPSPSDAIAVQSVTDGDTIVLVDGRRVRLAQVDAPETGECFGSESTAALRRLIGDNPVTLRQPSNGPEKDKYGRVLAEVSVNGVSVDEQLLRSGAAEWYDEFGHEDADIARRLEAAEAEARTAGRGLWSACAAGSAPAPVAPRPTPTGTNCHAAYPDTCIPPKPPDLDCSDIRRAVTVDRAHGDPHGLDADRDGVGCETYG